MCRSFRGGCRARPVGEQEDVRNTLNRRVSVLESLLPGRRVYVRASLELVIPTCSCEK